MNSGKSALHFLLPLVILCVYNTGFSQTTPQRAGGILTLAGNGTAAPGFSGDGLQAFNAILNRPFGIALDRSANVYFTDRSNNRIRKVTKSNNMITTIAGTGIAGFSGDGGAAAGAQLNLPTDICIDLSGDHLYFVDSLNFRVRKINLTTGIISTVAGNGSQGYTGQTVPAINAGIGGVSGVEALYSSTLFISLGAGARICIIDLPTGILSTFAGTGTAGFSGDGGPATNAAFNYPAGLSVDEAGHLYVADCFNHRIRKIDTNGVVTTVASNGTSGFGGDEGTALSASLYFPQSVEVDRPGNLFIADRSNHRIREVYYKTGKIYTFAGSGMPGYSGDGNFAHTSCTKLFNPTCVRTDDAGNLYIADFSNNCVRKVENTVRVHIGFQLASPPTDTLIKCPNSIGISYGWGSTMVNNFSFQSIQFIVNGISVAATLATIMATVSDGDVLNAVFSFYTNCNIIYVISDPVFIKALPGTDPDISISASSTAICTPGSVTFTAAVADAGMAPAFLWQVNGTTIANFNGTNAPFTINTLSNGDQVRCILRSSAPCRSKTADTSNVIAITANPTVTPVVNITTASPDLCPGATAIFNVAVTNGGNNPIYQWKINGINAGISGAVFSAATLQNGDTVSCTLTVDTLLPCATAYSVNSNKIVVRIAASVPGVSISASDNNFCAGTAVQFTATPQNAGTKPAFQWKINGTNTGANNDVLTANNLKNGDRISCALTPGNSACSGGIFISNIITLSVKDTPVVTITADSNRVVSGGRAQLTAVASGTISSYTWMPAGQLVNPLTLTPTTQALSNTTTFSLQVTNTQGCTGTAHITISTAVPLLMPSAFTPNNDGLNDVFKIPDVSGFTLTGFSVFNRWGNKIFSTSNRSKGWDGEAAGIPLESGVFIYTINGVLDGKAVLLQGSFLLIR